MSVSRAYTYSNHVAWVLGEKSWPCQGQGQDFSVKAKAKTLSSKAKTIMRCHRGSSRPRPGLEDNKNAIKDAVALASRSPALDLVNHKNATMSLRGQK